VRWWELGSAAHSLITTTVDNLAKGVYQIIEALITRDVDLPGYRTLHRSSRPMSVVAAVLQYTLVI
jgi:hypothetical protein